MSKILFSGCLLGQKVRYDGRDNLQTNARLQSPIKAGNVISICPEMAGGLPTPRPPAEIEPGKNVGDIFSGIGRILTNLGDDVTAEYLLGAQKTLELAQKHDIRVAVLKARSPSCGSKQVYDGTHSGIKIDGMGVTAALLTLHGIHVFDETEIDAAIDFLTSVSITV
ncbi:MAG TPA: DUF523 domain-containing protein [Gammaproteobacteria bacterium]|nr:DUF523 domain-containing protein [Gammaproteobacteria bacterium]